MWLVQLSPESSDAGIDVNPIGMNAPVGDVNWIELVHKIIAFLFIAGGFLCLLFLLWGGIQYITSGGKDEKIQKATHTVRNALIGLVIIILSFTIIAVVGSVMNRDLIPYLNFQTIIEQVNSFSERISR